MIRKYLLLAILSSIVIVGGVILCVNTFGKPPQPRLVREGNVVIKYVDIPTSVTDADLKEAVKLVDEWNQANYKKDWAKAFSLVYDTAPTPMPKDYVAKIKKSVEEHPSTPTQYVVSGAPYAVHNWGTRIFGFIADDHMLTTLQLPLPSSFQERVKKYDFRYHMVFKEAIAVPTVQKGINNVEPSIIYCVQDAKGQWRIAYSHLFELHP